MVAQPLEFNRSVGQAISAISAGDLHEVIAYIDTPSMLLPADQIYVDCVACGRMARLQRLSSLYELTFEGHSVNFRLYDDATLDN